MKETKHLIAHATANENREIYNGEYGDQCGFELSASRWWDFKWNRVYRPVSDEHKEMIADFMEKAVSNGYIGYDTNMTKRDTLYNNLVEIDFKVDQLNKLSLCDCSSLVYCAIYNVTRVPCDPVTESNELVSPRIRHFEDYINKLDGVFEIIEYPEFMDSDVDLMRGDIIVSLIDNGDGTFSGHTGVFV